MNKSRKIKFKQTGSKEELEKLVNNCKGRKDNMICKYLYKPCRSVIVDRKCPVIDTYAKTHTIGDINNENRNRSKTGKRAL